MSDSQAVIDRYAIEFRAVLGALGAIQLVNGVWALFAPSSFYGDFPFGRGWVAALPAYNEHLMRDVGELFLATGLVLALAAFWLERRLVLTAIWSYLLWSVPHAIYHFFNLEPYGTGDTIGNVVALSLTVLLPLWLLYRMRTSLRAMSPRSRPARRRPGAGWLC
jgi:hypothetical protein